MRFRNGLCEFLLTQYREAREFAHQRAFSTHRPVFLVLTLDANPRLRVFTDPVKRPDWRAKRRVRILDEIRMPKETVDECPD